MEPATARHAELRHALSRNARVRHEALVAIAKHSDAPPPSFIHRLFAQISFTDHHSLQLSTPIIVAAMNGEAQNTTKKKLASLAATIRKAPCPTQEVVNFAKVSSELLDTPVKEAALDLLVACIARIEATVVPSSGPQRRKKTKALHVSYRYGRRAVALSLQWATPQLFAAADRYAKFSPDAVASLGLLAPSFLQLVATDKDRFLALLGTVCMKAAFHAEDVIRNCAYPLEQTGIDSLMRKVVPTIERSLLREPEAALSASAHFFRAIPGKDMSPVSTKSFVPAIAQAVKSSEEQTRARGVALAEALAPCLIGHKSAEEAVDVLCGVLKSARYAYQKRTAIDALSGFTSALPDPRVVSDLVAKEVLLWLRSKKETNEEARLAAMRAIIKVICVASETCETLNDAPGSVRDCVQFLSDIFRGKSSESSMTCLLIAQTQSPPPCRLPRRFIDKSVLTAIESLVSAATVKKRRDECLHALTVLVDWDEEEQTERILSQKSEVWSVFNDSSPSSALHDVSAMSSLDDISCVIRCCSWMVRVGHEATLLALRTLYSLCANPQSAAAYKAREEVKRLHKFGGVQLASKMIPILWDTYFEGERGAQTVAKSLDFDDGRGFAEKLGKALMASVLPDVPLDQLSVILLAANHPRLVPQSLPGRSMSRSRYWMCIQSKLGPADANYSAEPSEDWLELCLAGVYGNMGLDSTSQTGRQAAANSLHALAHERNLTSTRVLRHSITSFRSYVSRAAALGAEDFEAIDAVQEAQAVCEMSSTSSDSGQSGPRKPIKKQGRSGNPRLDQQKQAEADRARAAAAIASAAAEKARSAQAVADSALHSLEKARAALPAITSLAGAAPNGVHALMGSFLSLVVPLARLQALEGECRECLHALCNVSSSRLRPLAVRIASTMYGLERGFEEKEAVAMIVYALQDRVPPALGAEDFSLISSIIQAAMLRDPEAEDQGILSGKRGSTKRRDAIAVVKAGAQVLLEHCKPEAVDSAVAAAACRAGAWAIAVLEREDGAFAAAADALALLTGTAINPGADTLAQVLQGVISGKSSVRDAALAALARLPPLASSTIECPRDPRLGRSLWLARFDPDEANAELANELWINYKHPLIVSEDVPEMLLLLAHTEEDIRTMSAKAMAAALIGKDKEATRNVCIPRMFTLYLNKLPHDDEVSDSGRPVMQKGALSAGLRVRDRHGALEEEEKDTGWPAREGVALAIESLSAVGALSLKDITVAFSFLAGRGLGDENDKVRAGMAKAATAVVNAAGENGPVTLLPMVERQLNVTFSSSSPKDEVRHADRTRENLVMCLGSIASFLPADDPKVETIARQVMKSALETPSEVVQNAAARCLVPLACSAIGGKREGQLSKQLLQTVWNEESTYGERRGAAYALAGISKGLGLKFMRRAGITSEIEVAVADKAPRRRQGAFLLIETHAILLRRLFEPYVVTIVPFLLQCMGDSVIDVRNSCWAAAQASMSELSSLGVKMILPSLLNGLKDRQWRTKAGSAEVLGAMAYCAPRQLSQCLPQVVPKLADALADAHSKVVMAAESAINRIAAVVRSPEVRKLSPFLLAALRDPSGRTRGAIDAMLGSEFVHAIDAASLALLIPPLHRGLRDRSTELKKRSAAIVGSMCNNVSNHADVVPYLDLLLPSLRITLLDAIPDVRRTSARALGALAVSLGETGMSDIVPWLVNALIGVRVASETNGERQKIPPANVSSSAERSGAAMGLAEVSASMSEKRLEEVLDGVLRAGQMSAEAREGGLMLIASMPTALGERFEDRLPRALAAVLQGLADDADSVREAALEAGRNLVSAYAKSSLERLLPELLMAMREKLWRIRQAATRLLGDMLLVIAGAAPERPSIFGGSDAAGNDPESAVDGFDKEDEGDQADGDEDGKGREENEQYESPEQAAAAMTTEAAMKAIEEVLGFDRRNEVLAALYIIRCDVSVRVRQTGMQVWKSVVSNTPRVLREIMPSAVRQIVDGLGDEDEERRAAAGKTLSDLSQKLGDRVIPEVLPSLRTGISEKKGSARIRKGACEGLSELILASSNEQLEVHAEDLIDAAYQGLLDQLPSVRQVAAEVFALLLSPLGARAVDAIIPELMSRMSCESAAENDAEIALDSLKQIMQASGTRLMAIIVPRLVSERPLKASGSLVLATAAKAAEGGFEPYVADVIAVVVDSLETVDQGELPESYGAVLSAIADGGKACSKVMLNEIFAKFNEGYPRRRIAASLAVAAYCRAASPDSLMSSAVPLLENVIRQLADTDTDAAKAAWDALRILSDSLPSSELSQHIPTIRQSLRAASTGITVIDSRARIPGLQVPRAPAPFVPIFSEGLSNEAQELREQAALAIGELIELTNPKSLAPFAMKLAGPLVRVMSARCAWQVKAAVLKAYTLLLNNGGPILRTFAPQMQSTMVKSLSDDSRMVRKRACTALGALVPIQTRLEPLLNDLVSLGRKGNTVGARMAAFHSCSQIFRIAKTLPASTFTSTVENVGEGLADESDEVRKAAGRALGCVAERATDSSQYIGILSMVEKRIDAEDADYTDRVSSLRAVGYIFLAGRNIDGLTYSEIERHVERVYSLFGSTIPELKSAVCTTAANLFELLTDADGMKQSCTAEKRRAVLQLAECADIEECVMVRVAALNALKEIVTTDDVVLELCTAIVVTCAAASNTGIRDSADRLLKRALLSGRELVLDQRRLQVAKGGLVEEDRRFIDRRIGKLRTLGESDDERE